MPPPAGFRREMVVRSRDYDDDQWRHYQDRLARRGLLDGDGALTAAGRALKQKIEDTTDALALNALDALDDAEVDQLFRTLTPIARAFSPPATSLLTHRWA